MKTATPLKSMRRKCLDCSAGDRKYVVYCPCDGVHSGWCDLWPYRFGKRPGTVQPSWLMDPSKMPAANTNLDDLPFVGIHELSPETLAASSP